MAGGINLAATTSGHEHPGWRRTGDLWLSPHLLLTYLALRLAREASKWFGLTRASGGFGAAGALVPPHQIRWNRRTRSRRKTQANGEKSRSHRMISLSTQVVNALIIAYVGAK